MVEWVGEWMFISSSTCSRTWRRPSEETLYPRPRISIASRTVRIRHRRSCDAPKRNCGWPGWVNFTSSTFLLNRMLMWNYLVSLMCPLAGNNFCFCSSSVVCEMDSKRRRRTKTTFLRRIQTVASVSFPWLCDGSISRNKRHLKTWETETVFLISDV